MADGTQSTSGGGTLAGIADLIKEGKKAVAPAWNELVGVVDSVRGGKPIDPNASPAQKPAAPATVPVAATSAPAAPAPEANKGLLEKGKDLLHKAEEKAAPLIKKAEEAVSPTNPDGTEKEDGLFGFMKKGFGAITKMFTDDGFSMMGLLVAAVLLVVGLSSMFGGGGAGLGLMKAVATGAGALLLGKQAVNAYKEHNSGPSSGTDGKPSPTPTQGKAPAIAMTDVVQGLDPEKVAAIRKSGESHYTKADDTVKTLLTTAVDHLQEKHQMDQKTALAITAVYAADAEEWAKKHPMETGNSTDLRQFMKNNMDSIVTELKKDPQAFDAIKNATTRDDAIAAAAHAFEPSNQNPRLALFAAGMADGVASDIAKTHAAAHTEADRLIAKRLNQVSGGTTVTTSPSQAPVASPPKDNHIELK